MPTHNSPVKQHTKEYAYEKRTVIHLTLAMGKATKNGNEASKAKLKRDMLSTSYTLENRSSSPGIGNHGTNVKDKVSTTSKTSALNGFDPKPLSSEDQEVEGPTEYTGNGGCTAEALYRLGLYSSHNAAEVALDQYITPTADEMRKFREHTEDSDMGTRGEMWHELVIMKAVYHAGYHAKKLLIEKDRQGAVDLHEALSSGEKYFVIGVTNNKWTKKCKGGRQKVQPIKYQGYKPDAARHNGDGAWTHSIAIANKEIRDATFVESVNSLWIDRKTNFVDRNRGYMRHIYKVYKITRCCATADVRPTCKGQCTRK